MKIIRIPFSCIRTAWVRRLVMVLACPLMVAGNWALILLAAARSLLNLTLWIVSKVIWAPFGLFDNFGEVWHGRKPVAAPKLGEQEGDGNG